MGFPARLAAGAVIGCTVRNAAGDELGSICELMLDPEGGTIAYAVLSHGGVIGVGEKLFAVPWAEFGFDEASRELRLEATPEQLAAAPGFDKDRWPASVNASWRTRG
jgi:hypothetical protein